MRKVLLVALLCSLFLLNTKQVYASATGHSDFESITFKDSSRRLLIDYSPRDYREGYNNIIGKKFFGWKTFAMTIRSEADYTSETLWHYKNMSRGTFQYNYKFEKKVASTISFNSSGGVSVKTKGKVKSLNLDIQSKTEIGYKSTQTTTTLEAWNLKIDVLPFSEAKLQIIGECEVSNGTAKYYAFWMKVKQGGWEVITVTSKYTYLEEISFLNNDTSIESEPLYE